MLKKANKKHQINSNFHSKDFSELQQLHIWPTIVLLLIICAREMTRESQSLGPYPIILTYWMQKEILSLIFMGVFLDYIYSDRK